MYSRFQMSLWLVFLAQGVNKNWFNEKIPALAYICNSRIDKKENADSIWKWWLRLGIKRPNAYE